MPEPLDVDIVTLARGNDAFRREIATGEHSQVVAMTIPAGEEIGEEVHEENDQLLVFVDGDPMEYPEYVSEGWQIGSGVVESACKTVVGQRLKLAGMRWGEDGADEMCHLRALFASGEDQWDAYWHPHPN